MAVPSLVSIYAGGTTGSGAQLSVLIDADLSDCDLAIAIVSQNNAAVTFSIDGSSTADWALLKQKIGSSALNSAAVFYKLTPTNDETLVVNTSAGGSLSSTIVEVLGANIIACTTDASRDPPSLDIGSIQDVLWIAHVDRSSSAAFLDGPTGYSNFTPVGANPSQGTATKDGAASQVEDPDVFSSTTTPNRFTSWTIGVWLVPPVVADADDVDIGFLSSEPAVTPYAIAVPDDASLGLSSSQPSMSDDAPAVPAGVSIALSSSSPTCTPGNSTVPASASLASTASQPFVTPTVATAPTAASLALSASNIVCTANAFTFPAGARLALSSTSASFGTAVAVAPASCFLSLHMGEPVITARDQTAPASVSLGLAASAIVCTARGLAVPAASRLALSSAQSSLTAHVGAVPTAALCALNASQPTAEYFTPATAIGNALARASMRPPTTLPASPR